MIGAPTGLPMDIRTGRTFGATVVSGTLSRGSRSLHPWLPSVAHFGAKKPGPFRAQKPAQVFRFNAQKSCGHTNFRQSGVSVLALEFQVLDSRLRGNDGRTIVISLRLARHRRADHAQRDILAAEPTRFAGEEFIHIPSGFAPFRNGPHH